MIGIVTSLHPGDIAVGGIVVLGFVWFGYLGCRLIGLVIDSMRRHNEQPQLLDEYADFHHEPTPVDDMPDVVGLPGDREPHSWPNMAPLLVDDAGFPAPAEPAGYPDLDEDTVTDDHPHGQHTPAPGRVSVDQVTGYVRVAAQIPVPVEDTQAMAAVAAVSGQDGAT